MSTVSEILSATSLGPNPRASVRGVLSQFGDAPVQDRRYKPTQSRRSVDDSIVVYGRSQRMERVNANRYDFYNAVMTSLPDSRDEL